jgi:hypothetical protein
MTKMEVVPERPISQGSVLSNRSEAKSSRTFVPRKLKKTGKNKPKSVALRLFPSFASEKRE